MKIPALKKTYKDQVILDTEPMELENSSIIAICGENGSGKSTFGKILAGILKPDSGKAVPHDKSNKGASVAHLGADIFSSNLRVGYMTQSSFAFQMSVKKNVMLNADPDLSKEENEKKADELIHSLGLDAAANKNAAKLSGGQMQRMSLARILMKDYDLLILDEPTASMDSKTTRIAEQIISEYHKKTNCLILIITHSQNQAERLSNSILYFEDGKIR